MKRKNWIVVVIVLIIGSITISGCIEEEINEERTSTDNLKDKLLSVSGKTVITRGIFLHDELLQYGLFITVKHKLAGGEDNECHKNAYAVYQDDSNFSIWTGYALNGNEEWTPHSWVKYDDLFLETTALYREYYGISLTNEQIGSFVEFYL